MTNEHTGVAVSERVLVLVPESVLECERVEDSVGVGDRVHVELLVRVEVDVIVREVVVLRCGEYEGVKECVSVWCGEDVQVADRVTVLVIVLVGVTLCVSVGVREC